MGTTERRATGRGFTLIEILTAVAILSILVGMAAQSYVELVREARLALRAKNLAELNNSLHDYYRDHGRYPMTLQALRDATHPYFDEVPIDPFTGKSTSWLVTNKSNWLAGRRFFTQAEFAAVDAAGDGIYRIKAPFAVK